VPFGIAQVGKAFRNEITPGNFIFRTREFEQMEMQFFVEPGTDDEWFEYWKAQRMEWIQSLGVRPDRLRFDEHGPDALAHYAKQAFDIQYEFPFGWQEFEGIHNRTDFDLSRHQEYSGKKLEYVDPMDRSKRYIPYVIETAVGVGRTMLVALADAYHEEEVKGELRVVMRLHPRLAPLKVCVLPLVNKDGMPEMAEKIHRAFRAEGIPSFFDDSGAIGRRYRRMDEAGTPFAITVDGEGVADGTVTVRHRDTLAQERIGADGVVAWIRQRIG
jgi:glycyl-tRNA synthetase